MHPNLTFTSRKTDIPLQPLLTADLNSWLKKQPEATKRWVQTQDYKAKPGSVCVIPAADGRPQALLLGVEACANHWHFAAAADLAPAGYTYGISDSRYTKDAALGWILGTYRYTQFKEAPKQYATLALPKALKGDAVIALGQAALLVRELINRPANDLTPKTLADAAKDVAKRGGATAKEISGDALLKENYPTIHAVGRACTVPPRLVDMKWNYPKEDSTRRVGALTEKGSARSGGLGGVPPTSKKLLPLVTLVGKGVCFDTGGLNIKTGGGMGLMKKDMGGAAHALGLAQMLMQYPLPIRLRVLVPIVENSISGDAFRPQDVIRTRSGLTVEIGNTDAEGRLILCDALTEADSEKPDLLIDMATLTGASRVALGPDIPSFFTPSDTLAKAVEDAAKTSADPLWRLPLWQPYEEYLSSNVADINNAGSSSYAGAITAALFLKRFITQTENWLHVDMMAWNITAKPGRPVGGEAQGLRALYQLLVTRYGGIK